MLELTSNKEVDETAARVGVSVCVAVCTRDRPHLLGATLDALARQDDQEFEIVIVAQGEPVGSDAIDRLQRDRRTQVLTDEGTGLSRARNLAWRQTRSDWVAFVDDDCRLEPDWISSLKHVIERQPDCVFIAGAVSPLGAPPPPYLPAAVFQVRSERFRHGRWRRPLSIGHGVCMAVRRETIVAIGGWDERFGPGVASFPAADDEDFNYRLLRHGSVALQTPALQARHLQWRNDDQLAPLFRGYLAGRGGVAIKHLRSGDVAGGSLLLARAVGDCVTLLASAALRRSRLRWQIACASVGGLAAGLRRGWQTDW